MKISCITLKRVMLALGVLTMTAVAMVTPALYTRQAYAASSAIDAKYAQLGWLGAPTSSETTTPDGVGRYRHYQGGSIYWTPTTGAHEVHGAIYAEWASLGWERSALGYPTTDEMTTPDGVGRYNHFQHGSIYWTPATGAHEVRGAIRAKWASLGWERSVLGYPISDEEGDGRGARYSIFEHGRIYWTPDSNAHEIGGAILDEWLSHQAGPPDPLTQWDLGYPTTDELVASDNRGRYNQFQNGEIYYSRDTGAHALWGHVDSYWHQLGDVSSSLGYPTDDQRSSMSGSGWYQQFQHGGIYQDFWGFDEVVRRDCTVNGCDTGHCDFSGCPGGSGGSNGGNPPPPALYPFYFKLVDDSSWVRPCFTDQVFAANEDAARQQAEAENPGYTVTPIDSSAYANACGNE